MSTDTIAPPPRIRLYRNNVHLGRDAAAIQWAGAGAAALVVFGVTAVGAAAAPLNPAYTHSEFAFYLGDLMPTVLIVPAGEIAAAREAAGPSLGDS